MGLGILGLGPLKEAVDALLVRDDDVTNAKPSRWVTEIHRIARPQLDTPTRRCACRPERCRSSHDPFSGAVGFNKAKMVPRAGLEPAPPD